jgi:hypothetical protein
VITPNQHLLKVFTLAGLLCLSVPLSMFGLWIYAFDLGTTQAERVAMYNSYFPDFLNGRGDTTYLSLLFSIAAIILSNLGLKLSGKLWRGLNIVILVLGALLLLSNLFSMM